VCGARKRKGGTCKNPAGFKTSHVGTGACHLHGGATPTHVVAAQREIAAKTLRDLGQDVDPHDDPVLELRKLSASLQASADALSDRIGFDLVDEKGRPSPLFAMWAGVVTELRQALTALSRVGVPETQVNVQVGMPVSVVFERIAETLRPWPDAAAAVATLMVDLAEGAAGDGAE
jgi:hypothetical protein